MTKKENNWVDYKDSIKHNRIYCIYYKDISDYLHSHNNAYETNNDRHYSYHNDYKNSQKMKDKKLDNYDSI